MTRNEKKLQKIEQLIKEIALDAFCTGMFCGKKNLLRDQKHERTQRRITQRNNKR